MVYDIFDMLLNSVCRYFIEDFCTYTHEKDWPIILFFGCVFAWFWMRLIMASYNELSSVPSLSISWKSLRSAGISYSLKA
jgi:fluoride ion exporter CrcB/FEX